MSGFINSASAQTDPLPQPPAKASFSMQTEEPPTQSFSIQTEPEPQPPRKVTAEMDIQTDAPISQEDDEPLASSSSTIQPPTPKGKHAHLVPASPGTDLPPAYEEDARDEERTLAKWHPGHITAGGVPGGISAEAAAEWEALKDELGAGCLVIDGLLAASQTRAPAPGADKPAPRRGRFYNIYNTYVYGAKDGDAPGVPRPGPWSWSWAPLANVVLCVGASAAVCLAILGPQLAQPYAVPGGPVYYDRLAWQGFNNMHAAGEGFAADGTAAFWNVFGRLGGGAARHLRGWPT